MNISSIFGIIGVPNCSAYCATKAAVRGFTESLDQELRERHDELTAQIENAVSSALAERRSDAKQRLKVLLIHDQVALTPAQLDAMKEEIMEVIGKYVEFEADGVEFKLSREDGSISLVSNVPVRRVTARAS